MLYHFGSTLNIKETDTIWILCPGASLDEFDLSLLQPDHITISLNSIITVFPNPTYQMAMDNHAIIEYQKYNQESIIWLTQPKHEHYLIKYGLPFISRNDLFEQTHDLRFRGSGSDAMMFAYFLCTYQPTIKTVNYVGLDTCEVVINNHAYYYSSQVKVLPFQKQLLLPKNWKSLNHQIKHSVASSYNAQRTTINSLLSFIPEFKNKLVSYSWYDFKTQQHDKRVTL